ncbi:MAG: 50S ribosomal protein L15 [Phycisphaera sp.]|nr:50S ribosomal protein L15 [Phycisphaera sp.]
MMIHEITEKVGKHKKRKRIGRGPGSGTGKTAARGHKGAGSRSGWSGSQNPGFEGGQMPYFRRIPKRGFNNARFAKNFAIINLHSIEERFDSGAEVNPEMLVKVGLLPDTNTPVKILGSGELTKKVSVAAHKFSESARTKIEQAGGACTLIS